MTKCWIDGIEYQIEDGHNIADKLSEELDSGVITIALTDKLDLQPYDKVKLESERETRYMCVNTWTDEIAAFNPLKYTYNIALISETALLQKIVLPNISIKHPIGLPKRTIRKKLEEYYEVYIKTQYPDMVLSQDLLDLTNDVECPEMAFSRPTMYEVINAFLLPLSCIVRVVNDEITYYDLDEIGQEIDESKIYFENETQTLQDYANRLDIQVENAVSMRNNYATPFGISVRGHGSTLTDENMYIELDKNIYDMDDVSVQIIFPVIDVISSGSPVKKLIFNISEYVVEKSIYDTYDQSNDGGIITGKRYKRNALYFTQGGNTIEGLSYTEDKKLLGESKTALWNIIKNVTDNSLGGKWKPNFTEGDIRDNVFFYIQYKSSDSFRLNVEKENKHNVTLIDNQNEQQVESNRFGKVEQDKLNRLGNKAKIINAVYRNNEKIPELSDYIGEYILGQREIVYYDDFAIFKGYLYRNYIRKNYYYGLSSKKRFNQISNEMVVRNDMINYNLSFQFNEPNDDALLDHLKRYLLMPIVSTENHNSMLWDGQLYKEYPKYTFSKFYDKDDNLITGYGYIMNNPSFYSCGRSNVISMKFKDNYSAGIRSSYLALGVTLQKYVPYVDDYGEFKDIEIELRSSKKDDFMNDEEYIESVYDAHKQMADNLPAVLEDDIGNFNSNYVLKTSKRIYKDSSEITAITLNFNFMDSENVIINNIADYTGIGNERNAVEGLRVCFSTTDKYEKGDIYGLGDVADGYVGIDTTDSTAYLNNRTLFNKITIYANYITGTSGWKSWGIIDAEGNLVLGVNNPTDTGRIPTTIYLKCEKKDY